MYRDRCESDARPLSVDLVLDGSVSTIVAAGDLDLATADGLVRTAQPAFVDTGARVVLVNLAGVGFCDSAGISALIQLRKLADQHGQELPATEIHVVLHSPGNDSDIRVTCVAGLPRPHVKESKK